MSLLVFGATGQVALELKRLAPEAVYLSRADADQMDPDACETAVYQHAPSAVVNAAAWTAVDKAEAEEEAATVVNAQAPGAIARACARLDAPFVQISTDYVFDGSGDAPFKPDDPTGPLGAYGRSKLLGEVAVRAHAGRHVILRTSWVFSAHGANFVKTMLRLSETRDVLNVVEDQVGGPTPASAIAEACLRIVDILKVEPERSGTYHFSGAPDVSWKAFAQEILRRAGRATGVNGIPTSSYPTPARRPANSRLDCTATKAAFGLARPDWRNGLAAVLHELGVARA